MEDRGPGFVEARKAPIKRVTLMDVQRVTRVAPAAAACNITIAGKPARPM